MLNKNDPLIGAVQEVMKRNHAEREAVKLVNEKFGVTDRKALPHERQGEWDAAYKSVLTEGLHPNQQKLDVHEPDKDELTSDDFRKLRAKKKPMEEDVTSPSSMGIPKPNYASGTPAYANKGPQMVNRTGKGNAETGMGRSENIAHQGNSVVTKTSKKSSSVMPSTMKEAKVNPYAVGMAAVEKSTGDEPPMEKKNIMKAHKIAKKIIARKKMNEGFNDRHDLSENASAKKQVVADQLNEDDIDSYENRMTAGLGIGGYSPYGGGRFGGGSAKTSGSGAMTGRVKASNINTRTGEPLPAKRSVPKVNIKDAPGLSAAAKSRFKKRLDAIQSAAPKSPKNSLKSSKKPSTTPAQPVPGDKNYESPIRSFVRKQNEKNAKIKANARPAKDIKADDARSEFLSRAKGVTQASRPASDVKAGDARSEFLSRAKGATPPRPASDVKAGDARSEFLSRAKSSAAKPPASSALAKTQQAKRISAIRRTSVGAGLALGTVASGGDPLGLDNTVTSSASTPKKKEITDRVPPSDAKEQGAKVGTSGLQKPSGTTAQPYGMNIPKKLDPDSRIAKGTAPQAQAPALQKKAAPQAQAPALQKKATKPAAQAPAVQKKAAPQANQPSASERRENRRLLDRGMVVGPEAKRAQQRSGTGVTTGTTVVQKPMKINKNLPGK